MNWTENTYDAEALAGVIDGTWGKTAQPAPGISVTARFADGGAALVVTASTTTKATPRDRQRAVRVCSEQLDAVMTAWVASVKKLYKTASGSSLSMKLDASSLDERVSPLGRTDVTSDYLVQKTASVSLG